jgi:hypothetical protein
LETLTQATPEAPFQRSLYLSTSSKRPRRLLPVASPPLPSQTSQQPKTHRTNTAPDTTIPFPPPPPNLIPRPRTFRCSSQNLPPPIHSPTFPPSLTRWQAPSLLLQQCVPAAPNPPVAPLIALPIPANPQLHWSLLPCERKRLRGVSSARGHCV